MNLHQGDCIEVMATLPEASIDAIVTDPPYGLEFMGKDWDRLDDGPNAVRWSGRRTAAEAPARTPDTPGGRHAASVAPSRPNPKCGACGHYKFSGTPCHCDEPAWIARPNEQSQRMQRWHQRWAEAAYRVAKPSAYLLAFGGTRTVHRMTCALEDAGWIIRDMLVWGYASGFPKSKASLKPAWEPIVMARKPGPLRMLAIDECRIGTEPRSTGTVRPHAESGVHGVYGHDARTDRQQRYDAEKPTARWPANIVLTDPIFDGGIEGVVGGGEAGGGFGVRGESGVGWGMAGTMQDVGYGDSGTYSRFFLVPKAARSDREPVLGGLPTRVINITEGHGLGPVNTSKGGGGIRENRPRANVHPTVKPVDLMRHLVRLVTPTGGVVLDPFLGSGTTALAADLEGFAWIGIEREAEYVEIARARLNGTQIGLALE